jgi:glyceraldehyde-3-phosphate dehydrogenase/erythrose-4-phosphate dehydrogenase
MTRKLRAGILGYGRMGRGFVAAMQENELWDVAAVYDISPAARPEEMHQILEYRRGLVDGFGLPVKTRETLDGSLVSS